MGQAHLTKRMHPMVVGRKKLKTAASQNIHSCGPQIVHKAIEIVLSYVQSELKERGKLTAYDPFCGNGVVSSVISSDWNRTFSRNFASDVDDEAVSTTQENLRNQVSELLVRPDVVQYPTPPFIVFQHNIHAPIPNIIADGAVDIVLTDPPYCEGCGCVDANGQTLWKADDRTALMNSFFKNLEPKMAQGSVVGIITCTSMCIKMTSPAFSFIKNCSLSGIHQKSQRSLHIFQKCL